MSARQVVQVVDDGDTSSCPPPRVLAIGPSRPPSTIGAHWGLTQGAKADKSSFTGERPSVSRTKAFLGLGEMPPDFLEGAGEDLLCMPFLGGACDCRTLVVSFVSKDF